MNSRRASARIILMAGLLPLFGCPFGGDSFQGVRCADAQTLETCGCVEHSGCSCTKSTCAPGVCITAADACAVSSTPDPACDPKMSNQQLCDGDQIYACSYGYRLSNRGRCAGVCAMGPRGAICAVSSTPSPDCDPALPTQDRCDGSATLYTCEYGYRDAASDRPCLPGMTCVSNAHTAKCIPANAVASALCPQDPNVTGYACAGSTIGLSCVLGYIVDNQKCSTCDPSSECQGGLSSYCNTATDCAAGLVCHGAVAGSPYSGVCTAPCTGLATGNAQCQAAAFSANYPYDATATTCNQGWCGLY